MASTIQGYEGTGRSLSLKLIHQLRQQSSLKFENNECKINSNSLFNSCLFFNSLINSLKIKFYNENILKKTTSNFINFNFNLISNIKKS